MKSTLLPLVAACLLAVIVALAAAAEPPTPIFPKALVPGDTIMFVAPSGFLDEPRDQLARKRLEELGFHVVFPQSLFEKYAYFGGTDDERAAQLNAAFKDPNVDAVFPGTGGYGVTRILDRIDYDAIRRHPKILVGFSDITGLHIAINGKTGLVTFHSPVPEFSLGNEEGFNPYAARWYWRALLADQYRQPLSRVARDARDAPGYTIVPRATSDDVAWNKKLFADFPKVETVVPGKARGRLIGGNLSVLHAMMGTPYEIQTDGKLLFLEDVGEAPYRIDRMLSTLKLAGKLDHVAGVILGGFSKRKGEKKWDDEWSMDEVLDDYFGKFHAPVVKHFPVGHLPFNTTLPVGAEAELDAGTGTIRLLENPVHVPERTE